MNGISAESAQILAAFAAYLVGVAAFGFVSHRFLHRGSFVKDYFVGGRGLGAWVLALTVAATAVSGGTFMGFPSLIYSNGWVMALWISSYMVVPLTAMVLLGRRINQAARVSGAVTLPDVLRDRFGSPALGVVSTLAILLFVSFNLVAQFKGGGLVLREAIGLPPLALTLPSTGTALDALLPFAGATVDRGYLIGLAVFAVTVVAYTTFGGFWAVTMTDVFEGLVMLGGVVLMAFLAVAAVPAVTTDAGETLTGLSAATERLRQQDPALVSGPGPSGFLPLGLAFSFFVMWSVSSAGQPSGMVRLMAFKDTPSLRRAVVLVAFYYVVTYLSLIVIFVCARAIFPTEYLKDVGTEGVPDGIMPAMARHVARPYSPLLAGLLLAAPYAAIMSTVAAFLLLISSSLVRDLYQRCVNPAASERALRRASYAATAFVGVAVVLGALNPPAFLQYVIVFTTSGQSCAFLFPVLLGLYWPRTTREGAFAGFVGGASTVFGLYVLGWADDRTRGTDAGGRLAAAFGWLPGWGEPRTDHFAPLYLWGVDPLVWGFLVSLSLTVGVSLLTRPDPTLTARYFPPKA